MEHFAHFLYGGVKPSVIKDASLSYDKGLITKISASTAADRHGRRQFVLPALINAHDHARPTASSFGISDRPLETWLARTALGAPPDPYLAAAVALARSARSGCAAMMVHYTTPSRMMGLVDEALVTCTPDCPRL